MDSPLSLDQVQREDLMHHYLSEQNFPGRRYCQMLLLLDDGLTVDRVAQVTYGTVEEVEKCVRRYRKGGVEALARRS
jgi:hypothetical protein